MPLADHERLVNALLRVKGKVLLLNYRHPIYDKLAEHGWHFQTLNVFMAITKTTEKENRRRHKERCLWMNYRPQVSFPQITLADFNEKPTDE
jgi:hypothetical protein